jgi:hypothetical protein
MRNASTLTWVVVVPLFMLSLALLQALWSSGDALQAADFSALAGSQGAYVGSDLFVVPSASAQVSTAHAEKF